MSNCRFRVLPLVALLLVSGPVAPAQTATASAPLEGRLFDGAEGLDERPVAGGHVFAISAKKKAVLGHATTSSEPGPEKGRWQMNDLPAEGEIVLIGFHEKAPDNLWIQRYTLTGRYNDLSIVSARKADKAFGDVEIAKLWTDLHRLGWVKKKVTAKTSSASAKELVRALLATTVSSK